jgi:hypothetical protein
MGECAIKKVVSFAYSADFRRPYHRSPAAFAALRRALGRKRQQRNAYARFWLYRIVFWLSLSTVD